MFGFKKKKKRDIEIESDYFDDEETEEEEKAEEDDDESSYYPNEQNDDDYDEDDEYGENDENNSSETDIPENSDDSLSYDDPDSDEKIEEKEEIEELEETENTGDFDPDDNELVAAIESYVPDENEIEEIKNRAKNNKALSENSKEPPSSDDSFLDDDEDSESETEEIKNRSKNNKAFSENSKEAPSSDDNFLDDDNENSLDVSEDHNKEDNRNEEEQKTENVKKDNDEKDKDDFLKNLLNDTDDDIYMENSEITEKEDEINDDILKYLNGDFDKKENKNPINSNSEKDYTDDKTDQPIKEPTDSFDNEEEKNDESEKDKNSNDSEFSSEEDLEKRSDKETEKEEKETEKADKKAKKRNIGDKIITIALIIAFIIGFCIYIYPYASSAWNSYADSQLMSKFESQAAANPEESRRLLASADAYNRNLANTSSGLIREQKDDKNYDSQLKSASASMMGFIEIPKIKINVPIFHYSSDSVLEKGIGHIYGSSLPVGGKNTHSLLSGHRGMPSAKMFTDLDRIRTGDKFYIHSYGRNLAYQVCSIKTVLPDEVRDLKIEKDKDLVTLVTCTPYGINSHRLLVTGKRCKYDLKKNRKADFLNSAMQYLTVPNIICAVLVVAFILVLVLSRRSAKKRKNK